MSNQFSHSKIDAFRVCPRKYQFQYIEKPQIEKQVAVEVFTGQVLHQVLQQVYEVRRMNKVLPREDMLALYDRGWEGAPLKALKVNNESLAVEDFIEDGRRSLEWYYDEHQPFDDGETLGIEEWVRLQIDPARDLNLRGKIDRLCRHSDGSVEIVDYKYKKGLPKQAEVESDRQMALYTLAVREGWPDFERVLVRMVYLKQKMTFRAEIDPETIELIREQTLQDILEIKSAERRDDFAPKESGLCNWCEFHSLCPAKRHRIMLDDEVAVSEPAVYARDLADKFLTIKQRMDSDKAELDQLKIELADLARELELAVVEGNAGRIKFTDREVEAFPTKTADKAAVAEIGALVRQADPDLYDVFAELNLNALLKAFLKDQLPAPLAEKLNAFIIKKRQLTARASLRDPEEIVERSD